ncbi:MAG: sporulation membrane protein YtaF [Halanaerobiales bacterium]|nr:sporulation membrane protein YtaF [Halanaerobiales bacterium]
MDLLYILFLAIAISLDGFFVGVTYGIRKIRVSLLPLCIISITSSLVIMAAMTVGSTFLKLISPMIAQIVGASILIGVGIMVLYETYKSLKIQKDIEEGYEIIYAKTKEEKEPRQWISWEIKTLGIIITILREPTEADFDASGSISNYEAIFLGLALALDALGAGFGAALTGYNPILIPMSVGLTKFIFLYAGNFFGAQFKHHLNSKTAYLPGIILLLLGVFKLF